MFEQGLTLVPFHFHVGEEQELDELRTILEGRTFCGWLGDPSWSVRWGISCEGVSSSGDMYGGPVGTDWSLFWRVFAGKGARSVGGMFWMRLWNCGLWSWCVVMGGWECPSFDQRWLGTVC